MKYIKNIVFVSMLALLLVVVGCDNIDDSRFNSEPETGWVEFRNSGATINAATTNLAIPIDINVPIYRNGIEVSFEIVPVEGDFNQIIDNDPGNSVFEPVEESDNLVTIDLEISGVADLAEQVIFDVVLTSTSVDGVSVGVGETSITTYRVSTPCPLDYTALAGIYSVDEVFTSGTNEGLSFAGAFGLNFQMEIALNPGDITQTQVTLSNSAGFDSYIDDVTVVTFDTCNGTVTFSPSPPSIADGFADFAIESAVYSENPPVITANGTLGNFGPYQFILTKQ